jgi:hypothetical protein
VGTRQRAEGLVQVPPEVLDVLQTDRQPQQPVPDTGRTPVLLRHDTVADGSRVLNE